MSLFNFSRKPESSPNNVIRQLGRPTEQPVAHHLEGEGKPLGLRALQAETGLILSTPVVAQPESNTPVDYGGVRFACKEITSIDGMTQVSFSKVINADVKIAHHMFSRIAVARLSETGVECAMFVDRANTTPDEVAEIVSLLSNNKYEVVQGYFAQSTLIIQMSQGHLNGDMLKVARDIARDPAKNALFKTFIDIVGWAYDNNANDIDWALDVTQPSSQICFKIGGKYIRPLQYLISTETMEHLLGIAWQRSGGGGEAQFDARIEQQAQVTIELPPIAPRRPKSAKVRLRWSGMSNDKGTVVTMRLQRLGESALVKSLEDAGYLAYHMKVFRRVIRSKGGVICFAGTVGSGKSTSLAQLLGMLPHYLKIQSIEDPVELDIPWAYQKSVVRELSSTGRDPAFLSAARAVYRSALDVLYLGEVRDTETGSIARQVVQSGHTVYTTTHGPSAIGIVDRLVSPEINIPLSVLGAPDVIKLLIFQELLPVNCPHCCKSPDKVLKGYESAYKSNAMSEADYRDACEEHEVYWSRVERLFSIDRDHYRVHDPKGCPECRREGLPELNGLQGRTVVCEMVEPDEDMTRMIAAGETHSLKDYWRSLSDGRFDTEDMTGKTAMECAIYKAFKGLIDPNEIEERFVTFETIEEKQIAQNRAKRAELLSRAEVHQTYALPIRSGIAKVAG